MSRRGGRGKKSHKGQRRHFTSEEEMQRELERNEREKEWRAKKGLGSDDEDEEKSEKPDLPPVEESSSGSESEEELGKPKGVSGLIAVSNPNRVPEREKKAKADGKVELSRREREELEKQQHHLRMLKLQDEGKTDQAKADLARLAIIRKQREEAAKKREQEKKAKEAAAKKK